MLGVLITKMENAINNKKIIRDIQKNQHSPEVFDRIAFLTNSIGTLVNSRENFLEIVKDRNCELKKFASIFDFLSKDSFSDKDFKKAKKELLDIKNVLR